MPKLISVSHVWGIGRFCESVEMSAGELQWPAEGTETRSL